MNEIKDFIRERICFYSSMYPKRSSAYEISALADKLGAAGVELMNFCTELSTPDMKTAREIGAYLRDRSLTIPCFSCGINLVKDDGGEAMSLLRGYAEICSELNIPYLHHTVVPGLSASSLGGSIDELFERGTEAALEINEYAAHLGVKTVIEDQGFVLDHVGDKPATLIPLLVYGAFMKNNRGIKRALVDEIYENLVQKVGRDGEEGFINILAEMYAETVSTLTDDSRIDEGNAATWKVTKG